MCVQRMKHHMTTEHRADVGGVAFDILAVGRSLVVSSNESSFHQSLWVIWVRRMEAATKFTKFYCLISSTLLCSRLCQSGKPILILCCLELP